MATETACPHCGEKNPYTAAICTHCSERIATRGATTSEDDGTWMLGCLAGLAMIAFVVWLFMREPDPERLRQAEEYVAQQELLKDNARTACNAGVQSACVEYAEMID